MRPYVLPFALGISIGLLFSFVATALPDSWILERAGFSAWKIPHFFDKATNPGVNPSEGLTNAAVILRYAAFMLENGYWFFAIPTLITCGYTKLRLLAKRSEEWDQMFHFAELVMKLSVFASVFFSLFAAWAYTGNVIEQLTMMVSLIFATLTVFWLTMSFSFSIALVMNPAVCDLWKRRKELSTQLLRITIPTKSL